ncbi:hypothetical protein KAX06_09065 [candidate division WOR-3 bacterium]|nr:hypothetical protein [candidate division WOR-3 bacterium]MCK4334914.1 hypothetical protein [candidate division WOR-3 bacterium]
MIKIEWYEGSRAEETPRRIIMDGKEFNVDEVIERAVVFDQGTQGYHRLLRVRCGTRIFRLIKEWDTWQYCEE